MLRRLSETFTATHLVALFAIAVLAPSALYAVTYANVVVTDSSTGSTAYVDAGRKLWVYDAVAGYTRNPANSVNIADYASTTSGGHVIYTVPAGKVLLIRSIEWTDFSNTEGNNSFYYLFNAANSIIYNTEGLHVANSSAATFDPGLIVRPGALSSSYSGTGGSRTYIQGYLIPESVVPSPTVAGAVVSGNGGPAALGGRPQ